MGWLEELHSTGDWRSLADWLCRHNTYLARGMAEFAASMASGDAGTDTGQPSPKQLALLVSLRGGVEALMRLEAIRQADEPAETARPRCGAYSKTSGQPCGNPVRRAGERCGVHRADAHARASWGHGIKRCGWRGKSGQRKPCRAAVQYGTDRCWHHQSETLARKAEIERWPAGTRAAQPATAEEIAKRDLPHSLTRLLH